MDTIIINTKKNGNAKFILELVKKLGESGKILTKEDQEDFLLSGIIKAEKTGKNVSRDTIFKLKGYKSDYQLKRAITG